METTEQTIPAANPQASQLTNSTTGIPASTPVQPRKKEATKEALGPMGIPRAAYQLYVDRENAALAREKELQKYYSFDSADHTAKLEKLKDLKLNPYLLSSGYDGLTNSLQRWKTIATSSEALKATPEQKRIAAENYYDKMLVPMYQKMGAEPINKKVWMEQAYDNALK